MFRDFISPWDWRHIGLENSKIMMYIGTWGLINMLTMCFVDKKSCSEKLFNYTQATKISENKFYEQNWSMLQMLAHLVRKGFRKRSVFCAWTTRFFKINNFKFYVDSRNVAIIPNMIGWSGSPAPYWIDLAHVLCCGSLMTTYMNKNLVTVWRGY